MSYHQWATHLAKARNGRSRPIGNNTRVLWSGYEDDEGSPRPIAIRYHSTNIITFFADGSITLANNGWDTVTTLQRLRQHSPARIEKRTGEWFIAFEHDPRDPKPTAQFEREIPKPFHAADPGPEPIDNGVGCVAGVIEEYEAQSRSVIYDWSEREHDRCAWRTKFDRYAKGEPVEEAVYALVCTVTYGEKSWCEGRPYGEYRQCPHCRALATKRYHWNTAQNGRDGYARMLEMLERYGSREAWQEAYITEFREVRENRKVLKAWIERNRAPFHDGIQVTSSGEVPLRFKRDHVKALKRAKRAELRYERIANERARELAKAEQLRAETKRVQRLMAEAMAESVVVDLELMRPGWQAMKDRNRPEVNA